MASETPLVSQDSSLGPRPPVGDYGAGEGTPPGAPVSGGPEPPCCAVCSDGGSPTRLADTEFKLLRSSLGDV